MDSLLSLPSKRVARLGAIPVLFFFLSLVAVAQKPRWVGNTPVEGNRTYKFVEIVSYGASVDEARAASLVQLAQDRQLTSAATVSVQTGLLTHVDQQTVPKGTMQESVHTQMDVRVRISGQDYRLQAQRVDEYPAGRENGLVKLHTLFMVALCDRPQFDRAYLTTSYGLAPVAMSVVPGLGQWYKGSKVKGVALFASTAAAVAGIIVCENQRSTNMKKALENPRFVREYSAKADDWTTGRNVCIGVAAGIWVYNLVDAAVARGARRVVVKPAGASGLALTPFATFDGSVGVSLAYRF